MASFLLLVPKKSEKMTLFEFKRGIMQFYIQLIYDEAINKSNVGILSQFKVRFFSKLYGLILKYSDPLVISYIAGFRLYIPFSHKLPLYLKLYPHYSSNMARIAKQVKQKYANLTFIDVGANIGDSIAILRKEAYFPILCIEGNEKFFHILMQNASLFSDIGIEQTYLGEKNEKIAIGIIEDGGTSYLNEKYKSKQNIQIKKISDVLKNKTSFSWSKMIKIDTDGFDCKILRGASEYLCEVKPIIFFEYDPFFLNQQKDDGISIFHFLKNFGYRNLLVYDNIGDFILSTDLDKSTLLEEIHLYFSGRNGERYCDLCVFHEEDNDLFKSIKQIEIDFFKKLRCNL